LVGGVLAALAGVAPLELHCANFEAWHVLVGHTAVLPVSAAVGRWWGAWWDGRDGRSGKRRVTGGEVLRF